MSTLIPKVISKTKESCVSIDGGEKNLELIPNDINHIMKGKIMSKRIKIFKIWKDEQKLFVHERSYV